MQLDAGLLRELRDHAQLFGDELVELDGRGGRRLSSERAQALLNVRQAEDARDLPVELVKTVEAVRPLPITHHSLPFTKETAL